MKSPKTLSQLPDHELEHHLPIKSDALKPHPNMDFKKAVFFGQIRRALRTGKAPAPPLDPGALVSFDPASEERAGKPLLLIPEAAAAVTRLLHDARAHAPHGVEIGVCSAFRDPRQDHALWEGKFATYHKEAAKKVDSDDIWSEPVRDKLVEIYAGAKAVGGFSNHSAGTAVDFYTVEHHKKYDADRHLNAAWKHTWLHRWLVAHAAHYSFKPLASEAWHWTYSI